MTTKLGPRRKMPGAHIIISIVLCWVVILTFFVPVSVRDPYTGDIMYNAMLDGGGNVIRGAGPQPLGLWDIIMAPVNGFQSAANIAAALLIGGGFLHVMRVTGGLEAGMAQIAGRCKGGMLIALMTLIFSLMGTVFGFWEEILAFSLVIVPMFIMAGYDVMTGLGVLFIGSAAGNMASAVNPFAVGSAAAAIGDPRVSIGSGFPLRLAIWAALYAVSAAALVRYGARVKRAPAPPADAAPEMTPRRLASVLLFAVMILGLLIGYIPWKDLGGETLSNAVNAPFIVLAKVPILGDILGVRHAAPLGEWGFDEFSFTFLWGSLGLMVINRMKAPDFLREFFNGAKGMLGVVFVLAMARGVSLMMRGSGHGISLTLVYWISAALENMPPWAFPLLGIGAYMLIGLMLQSTSGAAGISMPVLGGVAAAVFAAEPIGRVGGEIILISAFAIGLNFTGLLYPSAVNLGTIELFGVTYGQFFKFMFRYSFPLLVTASLILLLASLTGITL